MQDITPIEQYEGISPLAPIFYTPEYKEATDYFRGIVRVNEKSPRVLELTERIIRMNPGHYSSWQYRWNTLQALGSPLDVELQLMDELAVKYLKTYQVWHHRRLIFTHSTVRPPKEELEFIARSFEVDSKNYHTWSYRQWLLAFINSPELWEGELEFVEKLLRDDVRNNSAWHHRFFVVWHGQRGDKDRTLRRELAYVKSCIALAPNNASAWNYLRGVLDQEQIAYKTLVDFVEPYTAESAKEEEVVDLDNPKPYPTAQLPCVAAVEFMGDVYEAQGDKDKAVQTWQQLIHLDAIRTKYWEYRIKCL